MNKYILFTSPPNYGYVEHRDIGDWGELKRIVRREDCVAELILHAKFDKMVAYPSRFAVCVPPIVGYREVVVTMNYFTRPVSIGVDKSPTGEQHVRTYADVKYRIYALPANRENLAPISGDFAETLGEAAEKMGRTMLNPWKYV